MQFTPVSREDIPQTRSREGRVSTALVNGFIESGVELAKVDLSGHDKKMESVRATLSNYVRRHELPIKVFTAGGGLYLERNEGMVAKYRQLNADAAAKGEAPAVTEDATTESTEGDPATDEALANA